MEIRLGYVGGIEEAEDKKFIDFEGVFSADGLGFTENGGHNIRVYAQ